MRAGLGVVSSHNVTLAGGQRRQCGARRSDRGHLRTPGPPCAPTALLTWRGGRGSPAPACAHVLSHWVCLQGVEGAAGAGVSSRQICHCHGAIARQVDRARGAPAPATPPTRFKHHTSALQGAGWAGGGAWRALDVPGWLEVAGVSSLCARVGGARPVQPRSEWHERNERGENRRFGAAGALRSGSFPFFSSFLFW